MRNSIWVTVAALAASAHAYIITAVNQCDFEVWAAASQHDFNFKEDGPQPPRPYPQLGSEYTGSGPMKKGDSFVIKPPINWVGGRVWARTGCNGTGASMTCDVGGCPGGQKCTDYADLAKPMSVAEFGYGYKDPQQPSNNVYINLSNAQGFTLGLALLGGDQDKVCPAAGCDSSQSYGNPDDHKAMTKGNIDSGSFKVVFCPTPAQRRMARLVR